MAEQKRKYPRSFQLPFSQSNSSDDVWWKDCSPFVGKEVVVTSKLDGENSSIYRDGYHARSLDAAPHPSRTWLKNFIAQFQHEIPSGIRLCGENMYAFHSIFYEGLPSYFFLFGVYNDEYCLSWDEVEEYAALLDLQTVPVLYRGIWDEELVKALPNDVFPTYRATAQHPVWPQDFTPSPPEGYVVRLATKFRYEDFSKSLAKYVAPAFKESMRNVHWATAKVVPNRLKEG
jgi:hypothetical protein